MCWGIKMWSLLPSALNLSVGKMRSRVKRSLYFLEPHSSTSHLKPSFLASQPSLDKRDSRKVKRVGLEGEQIQKLGGEREWRQDIPDRDSPWHFRELHLSLAFP